LRQQSEEAESLFNGEEGSQLLASCSLFKKFPPELKLINCDGNSQHCFELRETSDFNCTSIQHLSFGREDLIISGKCLSLAWLGTTIIFLNFPKKEEIS
jgi:hypothetical protein